MAALTARLDFDIWDILAESVGVEMTDTLRYPDLVVQPLQTRNAYSAANPVAMVEILSPSSVKTDMFDKPAEYFTLPTLRSYLVLSQDTPVAWLWRRAPGAAAPTVPEEFAGRAAQVPIDGLDVSLPLTELYRGIPDGDPALTTTPAG
jgi:Uma2 family endonuclease